MARKTRAEAAGKVVNIRLSALELRQACEAAQLKRQLVGQFARDAILAACEECMEIDLKQLLKPGGK